MRRIISNIVIAAAFASAPAQAQQAIGTVSDWIAASDYPAEIAGKGQGGIVNLRFRIAPSGRVESCKPLYATAPAVLARLSCQRIEERARYAPAHDAAGNAVASDGELIARWFPDSRTVEVRSQFGGALPIGSPGEWMTANDYAWATQSRGDSDVELVFDIGAEGKLTGCGFTPTGDAETSRRTCLLLAQRARFKPPRGDHGQPLSARGTIVMHWQRER